MQDYFNEVASELQGHLRGSEVFTCSFAAEESDFVRFNHNEIRQAGRVTQRKIAVDLIEGQRHVAGDLTLGGAMELDRPRIAALVADLRDKRAQVAEDPHLLYATEVKSSERVSPAKLPDAAAAVADIQKAGTGRDLVGIYAGGGIHAGFANSLGQRNWQTTHSFNFDWSFYKQADKAVKTAYAGFEWQPSEFARKVDWAGEQLKVLDHPAKTIEPGRYRVYLAPNALLEVIGMLSWGGFGLKAHRTKQTTLIKMIEGDARMNPSVSLIENAAKGVAPNFQQNGFLRPDHVTLIDKGSFGTCLISPRSAKEYGVATNGANAMEVPQSVEFSAGALPAADVLKQLGTGVYVNNLWYLNYSDRNACRTTGMTRFATFWVENGRIVGPLNVMRFDETIYRALGENLEALTAEREFILDAGSYYQRSTDSAHLPGALIDDFTFTL
ncbi:MAG: TldE/PmbA family protein [Phycisphaerae bacterium]|nr:TldE/PmbA family protein [Phycisphaerae bacterium]